MVEIEMLTQNQTAEVMHVSPKTLEAMRQRGDGPLFHKFGNRVLYSKSSLLDYLKNRTFSSTSEY